MFVLVLAVLIAIIILFDNKKYVARELKSQEENISQLQKEVYALKSTISKLERMTTKSDLPKIDDDVVEFFKENEIIVEEVFEVNKNIVDEKVVALKINDEVTASQISVVQETIENQQEIIPEISELETDPSVIKKDVKILSEIMSPVENKEPKFKINSENWVGVNLLNRLGALLIVIGAIATASFEGFPPIIRSLVLFVLAFGIVSLGEIMNRKKPTTASMGVTAAGVALVYVAIAMSYFGLQVLGMYPALIACILATILGVFLAIRYDEQVVGCFALVGGYLPILAIDPFNDILTIGLIVYFLILSMYSLSIALSKKWTMMNLVGFILTIIGTAYLGWYAEPSIALLYAIFAFFLYIIVPLISTFQTKGLFNEFDVILSSINAFISSIIIFLIANRLDIPNIHGFLSLIFAIIYIGLAHVAKKIFSDKNMETIFKLTSIAFIILFVPFYFDARWFAIAWLVEAVVIASYGILREKKISEFTGLGLLGISAISLLNYNLSFAIQLTFNYTFFTIATCTVLGLYIYKKKQHSSYPQGYKFFTLANLWIFTIYIAFTYITDFDIARILSITLALILSIIYVKVKDLSDNGTHILANIIHVVSMITLWFLIFMFPNTYISLLTLTLAITMTAMVVYYKNTIADNGWVKAYKIISLISLWQALLFISTNFIDIWLHQSALHNVIVVITLTFITLIFSALCAKWKVLLDKGTLILANIMHGFTLVMLWLFIDDMVWRHQRHGNYHFELILGLALLFIAFAMLIYYKITTKDNKWLKIYKNINIVNLWALTLYIVASLLQDFDGSQIILILITFAIALAITRVKALRDEGAKIISIIMNIVGLFWLAIFNSTISNSLFIWLLLNSITQIVAIIALNDLIKKITNQSNQNERESPFKLIIIFVYVLFIVTQGLMVQGNVGFNSAIISIIYAVTSFVWIVLGFKLKNNVLRKYGLYLSIVSVAKLLILDTWGLAIEMRIISYFTLGLVLMLISFVYQRFSRKLDNNEMKELKKEN